ncbi:hypothetical protein AAEX28_07660 [Lentisphaerota bacterium WC36G]|nr:hypothetical protein LJT99_10520 [Lentisphaerae bacterium WC36]
MKTRNLLTVLVFGLLLAITAVGCINVSVPGKKGDDEQMDAKGDKQNFIKINTEKK